jgi:membrane-bound serine protease (ClpP class)
MTLAVIPVLVSGEIVRLEIKGPIDAITEEYIADSFKEIKADPYIQLVVLEIDTPGGFDTSMRSIIKNMLDSPVPVVAYVSPRGARAASAGFFITVAADIAAMAPGTNMGAASPVSAMGQKMEETMKKKVTNDAVSYIKSLAKSRSRNQELAEKAVSESSSYTAEECLENNLIDHVVENLDALIAKLDGQEVKRADGKTVVLKLDNKTVKPLEMSWRQKLLRTITNPSLAYFLLIFGLIGLYLEFSHPGIIIPGVIGAICLLLAFLAFQILPINYVGLILIILSIGFFIAEVKIQGFGMFGIGGIISFFLGSVMLINAPIPEMKPTMSIIIAFTLCFAAMFMFLTYKVFESMKRKTETGTEGLIGETGVARSDISRDSGKVFVHGEWWNAFADEAIPQGANVRVVAVHDFKLKVVAFENNV